MALQKINLKDLPWDARGIPWDEWEKRQVLCTPGELAAWIKAHDPETLRLATQAAAAQAPATESRSAQQQALR